MKTLINAILALLLITGCTAPVEVTGKSETGANITAVYQGTSYTLYEDCSIYYEGGGYDSLADMPTSPASQALTARASQNMPWCL